MSPRAPPWALYSPAGNGYPGAVGRRGAGICLVLLLFSIVQAGCEDRRSSAAKVALVGYRSVRLEEDRRVPEVDRAGDLTLRFSGEPGPILLVQGDRRQTVTATRTRTAESQVFCDYALKGAVVGPAEVRVKGARIPILITEIARSSDVLGYRTIVQANEGLVRELDRGALPFFRLRAPGPEKLEASFVIGEDRFELPIAETERRGDWLIVRTKAPANIRPGRGEVRLLDRAWPAAWVPPAKNPRIDELERLFKAEDEKALDEAVPGLLRGLDPRGRYGLLARYARLVRKRGDSAAFARALLTAGRAAEEAGLLSEVTRSWRAAAYAHLYARRFGEVGPLLDRAEALDRRLGNVSGLVRAAHYRGVMLTKQGRLRAAREVLADGLARAEQHGLDADRADLKLSLANLLQALGRHGEALRARREVADDFRSRSELDQISFLINLGWAELLAIESEAVPAQYDKPRDHLLEALTRARSLKAPLKEVNTLANLLWLAFLEDDDRETELRLKELSAHPHLADSYARLFVLFAEAQVRLRQGRFNEAERVFSELSHLADIEGEDGTSDYRWRASYGVGQARLRQGDRASARVHFQRALSELDRLAQQTDLTRSRALFFQDRKRLYDDAAELAIETKRDFEALTIIDRARTHVLRALEGRVRIDRLDPKAQQVWQEHAARYLALRAEYEGRRRKAELTDPERVAEYQAETRRMRARLKALFDEAYGYLDKVSPPTPPPVITQEKITDVLGAGVAVITFAGLHQRTDSFFVSARTIEHRRNASDLGRTWSHRLEGLHHLYVVVGGQVSVEDVLADLAASDLLERTSVSFLSHLGALFAPDPTTNGPPVVVADPDGTLPFARREGDWVAKRWKAELMTGTVTRGQVLDRIDGASAFHFAGHGVLVASQPWDAHLRLGRGETLSLEDLLVARPKVGLVVLSGCETGEVSPLSRTERIGLPHAFSLAGARAVLATTAEVPDKAAFRFIERFYEAGGRRDPADAYRKAALQSRAAGDATWSAFYLLGRRP